MGIDDIVAKKERELEELKKFANDALEIKNQMTEEVEPLMKKLGILAGSILEKMEALPEDLRKELLRDLGEDEKFDRGKWLIVKDFFAGKQPDYEIAYMNELHHMSIKIPADMGIDYDGKSPIRMGIDYDGRSLIQKLQMLREILGEEQNVPVKKILL
ncbi:MAG: hypothetical protein FWG66_10125 [Spirochaetes bacterium]|nr:hypothetical protein [Spirochaetota bacterium]